MVAGYYALLPLRPEALDGIIQGNLRAEDIKPEDILNKRKVKHTPAIYLYSLVMRHRHSRLTLLLFKHLKRRLDVLINSECLRTVYAVAATPEGETLMKNSGFQKIKDANKHPDGHALYSRDLSGVREGKRKIFARQS